VGAGASGALSRGVGTSVSRGFVGRTVRTSDDAVRGLGSTSRVPATARPAGTQASGSRQPAGGPEREHPAPTRARLIPAASRRSADMPSSRHTFLDGSDVCPAALKPRTGENLREGGRRVRGLTTSRSGTEPA
jgi:hypothetical protein